MAKVICSYSECKYCGKDNVCKKRTIHLSYYDICTLNNGRQKYLKCKEFILDDFYKSDAFEQAAKELMDYLNRKENKNE